MIERPDGRKMFADPIVLGLVAGTFMFWVLVVILITRLG